MKVVIVGLALILATHRDADACKTPPPCEELAGAPLADGLEGKLADADGTVAARAAITIARQGKPAQLAALGRALAKPGLAAKLYKLDRRCVLSPLLRVLAANPDARKPFLALIGAPAFAEDPRRNDGSDLADVLLRATAVVRPMAPEVLALWKLRSAPDDGWVNVTVQAVAENGTPEAVAVFEALLRDPAQRAEEKEGWLRSDFVGYRDNPRLLAVATRILDDGKLPAALHTAVIEAVFDYQQRWYGTCPGPAHAAYAAYSADARAELARVAAAARRRKPAKPLADAITAALAPTP